MDDDDAKPLDVGTGAVCASFDLSSAAWLSVGAPHPVHGFVELSALPAFDEGLRGDPAATRRHRLAMTDGGHAFLTVEIGGTAPLLAADLSDPVAHRWFAAGIEVRSSAGAEPHLIRQAWSIGPARRGAGSVALRLRGRIDRPALAEITEIDPPTPTGASTSLRLEGAEAILDAPSLPARVEVAVRDASIEWRLRDGELHGIFAWPDAPVLNFELTVALLVDPPISAVKVPAPIPGGADPLTRRALAYTRGCTALAVEVDERAILTDHRILPLSWTRDAYWQALALLAADGPGDRERIADHLRWLWRRCERPDGRWVRSHHANGRRKDLAFQADQQLYPLIELADYWRLTGSLPEGVEWGDETSMAWAAAMEEIDPATALIGSTETAADEPAPAPFIASSQVLLWYTAHRVAELAEAGALGIDAAAIRRIGASVRSAFASRFAADREPWPYAVDHGTARVAYHDANDLPIALAPVWGFCLADDPGWNATMRFAFDTTNPAWFEGSRPGLGSAHTPGPWTLGDLQAWLYARATGNRRGAVAALNRLRSVAFVDGMLPEAYEADGPARIRHWFAWPGAAVAALQLLDAAGRLEARLGTSPDAGAA